jgi:hypothetical protein
VRDEARRVRQRADEASGRAGLRMHQRRGLRAWVEVDGEGRGHGTCLQGSKRCSSPPWSRIGPKRSAWPASQDGARPPRRSWPTPCTCCAATSSLITAFPSPTTTRAPPTAGARRGATTLTPARRGLTRAGRANTLPRRAPRPRRTRVRRTALSSQPADPAAMTPTPRHATVPRTDCSAPHPAPTPRARPPRHRPTTPAAQERHRGSRRGPGGRATGGHRPR